jgi:hypothetical protein
VPTSSGAPAKGSPAARSAAASCATSPDASTRSSAPTSREPRRARLDIGASTRSPKHSSPRSRKSSSTAARGRPGTSSSPRCSSTSRPSTTASAATPRSAWSPRLSTSRPKQQPHPGKSNNQLPNNPVSSEPGQVHRSAPAVDEGQAPQSTPPELPQFARKADAGRPLLLSRQSGTSSLGARCVAIAPTGEKLTRAPPLSSMVEAVQRQRDPDPWLAPLLDELKAFARRPRRCGGRCGRPSPHLWLAGRGGFGGCPSRRGEVPGGRSWVHPPSDDHPRSWGWPQVAARLRR